MLRRLLPDWGPAVHTGLEAEKSDAVVEALLMDGGAIGRAC